MADHKVNEAEFKIIIPKYDNSQRKIANKELRKIGEELTKRFDGVTIIPNILGCYVPEGKDAPFCEESHLFFSSRDFDKLEEKEKRKISNEERKSILAEDLDGLQDLAKDTGINLGQESIYIAQDTQDEVTFVKGKYKQALKKNKIGFNFFGQL